MSIQPSQIIKKLVPAEPVTVNKVQSLGQMMYISFTGVNTNRAGTPVISSSDPKQLEILTQGGSFNFNDDPQKFALFAEAERINSAYQFDALFASSIIEPLPHHVEVVYKFLLPMPKIRYFSFNKIIWTCSS